MIKIINISKISSLLILIFLVNQNSFSILFSILGEKEDLYTYLNDLRIKASDHLDKILKDIYHELRILRVNGRLVKASYMENLYQQIYYKYSERIDLAFNDINQLMVLEARKADFYSILDQQKIDIIDDIKLEASGRIEPLLEISLAELKRSNGLSNPIKSLHIKPNY